MYATTHVLASVVISQHVPNLWWAFFVALISHYILDFIPHGDRPVERWVRRGPHLARSLTVLITDMALLTVVFATIYKQTQLPSVAMLIAAVVGGMLPDVLWIIYDLYKRHLKRHRIFNIFFKNWYTRFLIVYVEPILDHHSRIHTYIDSMINTHKFPAFVGVIIQVVFAGIFVILATYFW